VKVSFIIIRRPNESAGEGLSVGYDAKHFNSRRSKGSDAYSSLILDDVSKKVKPSEPLTLNYTSLHKKNILRLRK